MIEFSKNIIPLSAKEPPTGRQNINTILKRLFVPFKWAISLHSTVTTQTYDIYILLL